MPPDPHLVASTALAKAQALEARVNALAAGPPVPPSLVYTAAGAVITATTDGTYTWTCPAGVTAVQVECWGAGAGGGGGGAGNGGEGGGGGGYILIASYPVVPGTVYTYTVGNGGTGGTSGNPGSNGGNSVFDSGNVIAYGGQAGVSGTGGPGGGSNGGANSLTSVGGTGGANNAGPPTGGGGGGSSGTRLYTGSNGAAGSGSSGGAGGAGTTDMGSGGNGGNAAASGTGGGGPGGGGGAAGASTGATQGTNYYRFTGSYAYYGADAAGGNANAYKGSGTIFQGGETASGGNYNGTMKSVGVLPGSVASDLSGVTIDSVTLRTEWLGTWYNNGAYIIIGYVGVTTIPVPWDGLSNPSRSGLKTYWQGNVGQPQTQDLTSTGLGAALKSGAAKSLMFGAGPSYDLYNYGYMYGAGGDNNQNPLLTVCWHTGAAPVQGGAGHDGQVRITYAAPPGAAGTLTAALQPAAGTDTGGNGFALGYTGPVAAYQPGSSPNVVEVPHSLSPYLTATWAVRGGGYLAQFYLTPDGRLQVDFELTCTSQSGNVPITTALPAGYWPAHGSAQALACNATVAPTSTPVCYITTAGVLNAGGLPAGTSLIQFSGSFPLN